MPRLGQQATSKQSENGKLYYGDKDAAYLKELSREAVEEHHNSPILFFQIDWERSKRNFYGEMTMKKFLNPRGVQIRGIFKIQQGEASAKFGIPNKTMKLTVSVYFEQLKELGIDPKIGDYFGIGHRLYQIYDKTIEDAGPGNLMMNRERMRADYFAFADDDEALQKDIWGDNLGMEYQINNQNGEIVRPQ